jgi:hypothetical protein
LTASSAIRTEFLAGKTMNDRTAFANTDPVRRPG